MIMRPMLKQLFEATDKDEAIKIGAGLHNYLLRGEPPEAIYVFAYESWDVIESIVRVGQTEFNIEDFGELPREMQTGFRTVGTIWGELFRKFPYDMSVAFVEIFDKSDSVTRKRLTGFALAVSKYLGRDVMDIAEEQLGSKRR
jgi:hypothetical protein